MADVIARLKLESGEFDSKIQRATKGLLTMEQECRKTGGTLEYVEKEQLDFVKGLGQMETVSQNTRGKINELSGSFTELSMMYKRLTAEEKSAPFGRAMAASMNQLKVRIKDLKVDLAGVESQLGGIGKAGIGAQFGQGLKSAFSMFGPAALAIGGVTAAIGGLKKVMGDMVSINMQFEQGTAVLASIIGKTTDEISALTDQAKQLGATTRYTAMQITELQTNLARLGFSEQEILNSTKAIQAFATATGADLGEAANLAGAALRGFGMNATEMERAASVMAVSTTKSALSFEKLATAVPIVAPVAKQFGFTIEDTITLLGKLSDAGMDASTAATATRNIFLKMADGSGKLSQAMGKPVHSVEEFGEALAEMRKKGMDLNDILKMVGVRSTAAFAVFADNVETLKDFKQSITDCGDAMGEMENKQINTLQGSIVILNSAWEGLMLSFNQSNGPIKKVVDGLTNLLQAWTRWRNRNAGGDAAIKTYELAEDDIKRKGDELLKGYRAATNGRTGAKLYGSDEDILNKVNAENEALNKQIEALKKLEQEYRKYESELKTARNSGDTEKAIAIMEKNPLRGTDYIGKGDPLQNIYKAIAAKIDKTHINEYIASALTPAPVVEDKNGKGKGGLNQDKSLTAKRRAQIEAQMQQDIAALDKANMIKEGKEEEYEDQVYAIKKAALEQIKQLYAEDTKEYAQVLSRSAQLDIQYQNTKLRLAQQTNRKITKSDREAEREREAALRQQKQLDTRILGGLTNAAKKAGWTAEQLGTIGIKTQINAGIDITDEQWKALQDKLNERLQSLGLDPIQIDFETGNIETVVNEAKAEFERLMSDFSSGVGAVSDLVGAMDNLKSIGEDLADVFSGEKDAWESMMTVFESGIGILNTVISVTEAINTLKSLGIGLSEKKATTEGVEAAATVAAASTEASAEGTKAAASLGAAGANAAESSSAAGKAVAGIPIIGPVLAVAAIASVLGAVLSAISQSKSAGKYAQGGIVPGNSFSGDRLTASVNSGELILSRSQQDTIAAQLQGNPMDDLNLSLEVEGTKALIWLNNTNRSLGGDRDFYSRRH